MEEVKTIIGENLANLRKEKGLTQLELAELFNYSDKAVSKWEKGDTLPDVETLYRLCEFYGVTLDYLTHQGNRASKSEYIKEDLQKKNRNNIISTAMMLTIVWMVMTIVYVYVLMRDGRSLWTLFIWAIPASSIVFTIANKLYFGKRMNYFISYSVFVWSTITSFYIQFLYINAWPLFMVGIPAQIILILWANFKPIKKREK